MVPEYEPTIPEWFHQQYELEQFLAESRARFVAEEKTAKRRRRRYFVGTAICWSVAALLFLFVTKMLPGVPDKGPLVSSKLPRPFVRSSSTIPARTAVVTVVEAQPFTSPLLPEADEMKRVLSQLGAIEVQGSLYTSWGSSYQGPLWVRKVIRGETVYLDEALHYQIAGPFRLMLPVDSTVYIYAPVPGLAWNGGWGVPIQIPSSINCSQPTCALRLEELMFAATHSSFRPVSDQALR
jgi:hypothetical protein